MRIVGIDEVGRGCWAGPLVAGAVLLSENFEDGPIGLKDSKKLSKTRRDFLDVQIRQKALAIGLGWVWPSEIDAIGITASVKLAMERAISQVAAEHDEIIIDGNINYFSDNPRAKAVIKADDSVPAVSAASIVAKVARDKYMSELGEKYAGYAFEKHVGYGTALHIAALKELGVSDIHRMSYKPIKALSI